MADEKDLNEGTEEPVVEETAAEETPVVEEPTVEEPAVEETPVEETPVAEEAPAPVAEEAPAVDEPLAEEPAAEEEPEAAPAPVVKPSRSQRHVPRTARRTRTKTVREKATTRKPITRTEKPEYERGRRQERRGIVVSDKADKTIIVKVDVIKSHPKYKKVIRSTVKFHAHDEANTAGVGDTVRIVETRPLSKLKHWRLAEIVEKAR
jgi:small subunit ribosomal protein S17